MAQNSIYIDTLTKLQSLLRDFDMSFGISNKIFRLSIVSEIIDTQCLFEQLLAHWQQHLPWGEEPDGEIDFSEWGKIETWDELISIARQNVCVENVVIDHGNGDTPEDYASYKRKGYNKQLTSVVKASRHDDRDGVIALLKYLQQDRNTMMTYGDMVFRAINGLCSTLRSIDDLLKNPEDEQLLTYYSDMHDRYVSEYSAIRVRVEQIHKSNISEKRKENGLRALYDELKDNLSDSGLLSDKQASFNAYDIVDYKNDHPEIESNDAARLAMAIEEFSENKDSATQIAIARYLFEHRLQFSKEQISTLFVFLMMAPTVQKNIGYVMSPHTEVVKDSNETKRQDTTPPFIHVEQHFHGPVGQAIAHVDTLNTDKTK